MIRLSKTDTALLAGFCVVFVYFSLDLLPIHEPLYSPLGSRRNLQAADRKVRLQARDQRLAKRRRAAETSATEAEAEAVIYPWAKNHLQPLTVTPDPSKETVLFWHIPKSGGTTAKSICECFDVNIASRAGSLPRFGHGNDSSLLAFRPWRERGPVYLNVDTTTKPGIDRAAEWGLVPSGLADVIFTSDPGYAVEKLYDEDHKGRVFALFRHPIDRLVSKFYYLQVATWEKTYHPSWKNISLYAFANSKNNDNNHYVKKLAGKRMNEWADEEDLQLAMATIKERFIVGLMSNMEESIHRFNVVMGIKEAEDRNRKCMEKFFGDDVEKKNSNSHPNLEEGDGAWQAFAKRNKLDIRLYDYILQLFDEQRELVESYTKPVIVQE